MADRFAAVFIYTRVSTAGQEKEDGLEGIGIQAQEEICMDHFETHLRQLSSAMGVVRVVSDTGSTFNNQDKLVNLDELIEEMPECSLIIVHDITRLGRNTYQVMKKVYEEVERKKSFIYAVQENKFFGVRRMDDLDFFRGTIESEAFSCAKSQATKSRFDIIRRNGGYIGGIPFGKMIKRGEKGVHKLVSNPDHQKIIRFIHNLKRKNIDHRQIINLTVAKFPLAYRNAPLTAHMIRNIIRKFIRGVTNVEVDNLSRNAELLAVSPESPARASLSSPRASPPMASPIRASPPVASPRADSSKDRRQKEISKRRSASRPHDEDDDMDVEREALVSQMRSPSRRPAVVPAPEVRPSVVVSRRVASLPAPLSSSSDEEPRRRSMTFRRNTRQNN